ncbi:MAG: DNA repair protein RecN [Actinobacteria bacterium]|nr:DNA repair protein RecN [Actinomycetota bacterium]
MLRELHIGGLGVIEDLDLELHEGLNVLTGETGTGKTMVTVGLSLALGARASASLVRKGAAAARVQARFDAPPGADEWAEDGEIVLARTVSSDGRGSARISGQIATASALAELGSQLVELHGQHQTERLLSPATQAAFLDRYAGDEHVVAVSALRETFERLRDARAALAELAAAARDRERELDLLAYQVREIEAVGPSPGESDALGLEEARLGHVERLLEHARAAEEALGSDGGLLDVLASAAAAIHAVASVDAGATELSERAGESLADLGELSRDLRDYRESLSVDPERLQEVRERIGALKGLQRKYGATDEEVLVYLSEASARLASLSGADARLATLEAQVGELNARTEAQASVVSAGRAAAAPVLAAAIESELHELGMPGARVQVGLDPLPETSVSGAERVELRFAGSPGQDTLPLAKTASGGELSRTMLACRSVLADLDDVPTLVFDEVDAGIGGEAGLAVGRRLARLALGRQVLVVTHLPQIACFADRHIRVEKSGGTASVEPLSDEERVRELSRMLAGLPGSERALSHAEELLAEAGRERTPR